jgi:2,4-dienoyl-CoA reductase-like NADH-dependent reductase (Old Yellow Enzyme family)
LEYRISASELTPGGLEINEATEFIKMIQDKIDLVQCSVGLRYNAITRAYTHPSQYTTHGHNIYLAEAMKKSGVKIPVVGIGAIDDPDKAEKILANGQADVLAICRGIIADPEWCNKARAGKAEDIVPCIKCSHCIDISIGRVGGQSKAILQDFTTATRKTGCTVNPLYGREHLVPFFPQPTCSKIVVVVGGGP